MNRQPNVKVDQLKVVCVGSFKVAFVGGKRTVEDLILVAKTVVLVVAKYRLMD